MTIIRDKIAFLKDKGMTNYLQGFKFSRPIPIEKLNEYFEK